MQIRFINEGIHEPYCIISTHLVVGCCEVGLMLVVSLYKLHAVQQQKLYSFLAIHIVCIFVWQHRFFHKLSLCVIPPIPETELNSLANVRRVYELYTDSL